MSEPIRFKVDSDLITVDAFLELVELQESMTGVVKAATIRRMVELVKPSLVDTDLGKLPYSQLKPAMEQIMAALNNGIDPN